jgi:polysaccharide export outer membrane protein
MNQSSTTRRLKFALMFVLCGFVGCSTAASLGLPVGAGSHRLMGAANARRESSGRTVNAPRELAMTVQRPHRIEAGDVMLIEPNDFNSVIRLPGDQTVLADGTIELGTYGTLSVAGLTVPDVQCDVQALISAKEATRQNRSPRTGGIMQASARPGGVPDYGHGAFNGSGPSTTPDNSVSVRLVRQESTVFYVLGEVNAPGSYPLVGNETVLDAIIAAGGVTTLANEHKIILSRPAEPGQAPTILPICYQSIVQLGDTSANYQIYPGDRIYVPSLSLMEDVRQSLHVGSSKSCPHCKVPK